MSKVHENAENEEVHVNLMYKYKYDEKARDFRLIISSGSPYFIHLHAFVRPPPSNVF